jgi:hypothetical protein
MAWLVALLGNLWGLCWRDFDLVEPEDGPTVDLPRGCGVLDIRLGLETKTSCSKPMDIFLAYQTLSGYYLGKWLHRARRSSGIGAADYQTCAFHIFIHALGTPWTSLGILPTLYPLLKQQQQVARDAMLLAFDGSPGNTVAAKFWYLHCFRRGAP